MNNEAGGVVCEPNRWAWRQRPDLMVLDLNVLPGRSGREVLGEMMKLPELRAIPVAILTTAASEDNIAAEYPGMRVDFAAKTPHFDELAEIIRRFARFARGG